MPVQKVWRNPDGSFEGTDSYQNFEMTEAEARTHAPHLFRSQSSGGSAVSSEKITDYHDCFNLGASDFAENNGKANKSSCANRSAYEDGWHEARRASTRALIETSTPIGHNQTKLMIRGNLRGDRSDGTVDG